MASARELVEQLRPELGKRRLGRVVRDTTEFMSIGPGDVIAVGGRHHLVYRDAVEEGPGYRDTKYWVKKCVELESGDPKLLKLVFHEQFDLQYGCVKVRCYRSPRKEGRILDMVRGDLRFMQGRTARDEADNRVRIIDIIAGKRIDHVVASIPTDHAAYFRDRFPSILAKFAGACEAIGHLHDRNERHGDINLDHLMREYATGAFRWIDFDYAYESSANPFALDLFGLGRLLACITGKGMHTAHTVREFGLGPVPDREDFSCVHKNEIMNLKKLFPYIPDSLNRTLLHFSAGAEVPYDTVAELTADIRGCLPEL